MSRSLRVAPLTADEQTAVGATGHSRRGIRASVAEELRILIVGGIPFGVVVAGLGSRVAMFLLRITSPESSSASGATTTSRSAASRSAGRTTCSPSERRSASSERVHIGSWDRG